MTKTDRRTNTDRRVKVDESVYLREAVGNAARVWVLSGAKPTKLYTYVDNRWVEITLKYNGEEAPPHRRVQDAEAKESDYLAGDEPSWSDAAHRIAELKSDRSVDA